MKRVCSVILLMCLGMFLPLGSFAQIAVVPDCEDCKPTAQNRTLPKVSPADMMNAGPMASPVVKDGVANQTARYYDRPNLDYINNAVQANNRYTHKVIEAQLKEMEKTLKAAAKAKTGQEKTEKEKTYETLVDELNKGILADLEGLIDAEKNKPDTGYSVWFSIPNEDVVAKIVVLENNIADGVISNRDYARAVNAVAPYGSVGGGIEVGVEILKFRGIVGSSEVVKRYEQSPAITQYMIDQLSSVGNKGNVEKFLNRESNLAEVRLMGLARLKSREGVEKLIEQYWQVLGKNQRYSPASSPEDAFLIEVMGMAVRKYPIDTPYLLRKWTSYKKFDSSYADGSPTGNNKGRFLMALRGAIELGQYRDREKYFSEKELNANKKYLEQIFCKVDAYITGANNKFFARQDISRGWNGGLWAYGTNDGRPMKGSVCNVYTPNAANRNDVIEENTITVTVDFIIGWIMPFPKIPGIKTIIKNLYKSYRMVRASVKSGNSLRKIYQRAKTLKNANQVRAQAEVTAHVAGGGAHAAGSGKGGGKSNPAGGNSSNKGTAGNNGRPALDKPAVSESAPATSYNPRYEQVPEGPVAEGGFSPANPQSRGVPYRENPPRKPWERPDVVYAHPQGAAFVGDEVVFSKQIMHPTSVSGQHHAYILKYSGNPQRPVDVYVRTVGQEGKEVYRLLDVPESALSLSPADIKRLQGQRNGVRIFSDLVPGEISGNFNKVVGFHVATERSIGQSVISNAVNSGGHIKVGQVGRGAKAGQPEIYFELTDNEMKILGKELKNLRNKNRIELKQIKQLQNEFDNLVHQLRTKTNANVRMGRHEVGQFPHAHFENTEQGISEYLNINLQGLAGQQEESVLKAYLFRTFIGKDQKLMQELLR